MQITYVPRLHLLVEERLERCGARESPSQSGSLREHR